MHTTPETANRLQPSDLIVNIGKETDKNGVEFGPDRFEIRNFVPAINAEASELILKRYRLFCEKNGKGFTRRSARKFIQENQWVHDAWKV
jgi:hypothetical protein